MRLFVSLIALALIAPAGALAQTTLGGEEPLSLILTPSYPRPYEDVTITVQSNLLNLAASEIAISVNGTVINEGNRSAAVKVGGPGSRAAIRGTATVNGKQYQKQITVIPADVALVIEADSTTHPFYKGAGLVPPEGRIRLIALPDVRTTPGTRIASSNLVYTWRLGDKILTEQSGIGKNVFVASAPERYRDADVSVTVTTRDQAVTARSSLVVSPVDPLVRVYRTDPLSGTIFARAIKDAFSLSGDEETFTAVPYYFKSAPPIAWTLNGNPSGQEKNLTVRSGGNAGSAVIGVTAGDALSQARSNFTARFGNSRGSGFLGL